LVYSGEAQMKKLVLILSAALAGVSSFAQGRASFSNRTSQGDWPVALPNGQGAGTAVAPISVDLYPADATGTPMGASFASTRFRSAPAAATFFVVSIDELVIPNALPGTTSAKLVAVISGGGYKTVFVPLIINPNTPLIGNGPLGIPPAEILTANANLLGSTLVLQVPEPSSIYLLGLGVVFLLIQRIVVPYSKKGIL